MTITGKKKLHGGTLPGKSGARKYGETGDLIEGERLGVQRTRNPPECEQGTKKWEC